VTALRRPSFEALLTSGFVLIGCAWGAFLGARQISGLDSGLDRLEYLTLDWRFLLAGPKPAPRGVVIAAVDDDAIRALGSYPLPRDAIARIVRQISALEPQAIAIDMLFLDPGKPDTDTALADALGATRSVVAAVGVFDADGARTRGPAGLDDHERVPAPSQILWPIDPIRQAARTGLVNVSTDNAGVPRFLPMLFRAGDGIAQSLALAAASLALNTEPVVGVDSLLLAARKVDLDIGYHLPIRYYGPRGTIRQFSIAQMLRGDLPADLVRGQLVIIGATAFGTGDMFAIPFDRVVPGVEVIATGISNLLAGDGLVRSTLTRKLDAAAAVILPLILVLCLAIRRTALGAMLGLAVLALWLAAVHWAFLSNIWLGVAVPFAAAAPVAISYGLARLVLDRATGHRLSEEKRALAKFQSPALVQHILANPRYLESPVQQDIPVIFLDLSGFTGVAEALGPKWVHDLLSEFQSGVEREAVARGGCVVNFAGDGAMIVFGVPVQKSDDGSRALRALTSLHASISGWLATLPPVVSSQLSVRVGGHYGPVMLSRLGASEHQHVTATGDTVNVTSRLLEIAKQQKAQIVISEDLWNAASAADRDANAASAPIEVSVRGRSRGLLIRLAGPQLNAAAAAT
jgi:adenylate cyclase